MVQEKFSKKDIKAYFEKPFIELMFEAQVVHRKHHNPLEVQLSTLLSIKTGACVEDCGYCSQSARYDTKLEVEPLMDEEEIIENARKARLNGGTRFCMGAAWKNVPEKEMPKLKRIIEEVNALGLETCMTLGGLTRDQAESFNESGLDYYNHNLDTSREYYKDIITTRTYQDRLDTIDLVRESGIKVCSGGIMGLGETQEDRISMFWELANMDPQPESVPVNQLVPIPGTPLADKKVEPVASFDFIKCIAISRILMPKSQIRLSAGREVMSEEMQAMCFMAGANSVFFGDRLLTTNNPDTCKDYQMFKKLGLVPQGQEEPVEI
ncbi:MAG: biotin synthase BioB [Planctomycetota bacterium]|nr:MAG: biotin synthase BioB [Planctomycetota bacterium]